MPLDKTTKSECSISSSVPEEITCACGSFVELWSDEESTTCDDCGAVVNK